MKLENQVCSLKLAKKLKKLGVKQESLWYWMTNFKGKFRRGIKWELVYAKQIEGYKLSDFRKYHSAFTVAELGEMLPGGFNTFRIDTYRGIKNKKWICQSPDKKHIFEAKIEANARTKMLIYLIENKLLKEVRNR